ncbi:MAG: sugar ABC transporter ATP-binding protein, partial [Hyphomicrobiales bacterium]
GAMALSGAHLDLAAGRVHALMGENGAGKSTLIKLLAGVHRADMMDVSLDGHALALSSTEDARKAGFRFIHQELNIVPHLSVAENIFLGWAYPRHFGFAIDWKRLEQQAQAALSRLGVDHIDVTLQAARLSTGDRMLVKIAGSLVSVDGEDARLYVLDEPTAALAEDEAEKLFRVIEQLKTAGVAILYVSHRMNEVMRICDDVTVLRDGKTVLSSPIADTDRQQIIFAMTGRDLEEAHPERETPIGERIVCAASSAATEHIRDVDFELHEGEIIGVCGLTNAGQSELLQMFMGLSAVVRGSVTVAGQAAPSSPFEAWQRNIAYVPRERRSEGLMLRRSVQDNMVLPHLSSLSRCCGIAHSKAEQTTAARLSSSVRLKAASPRQSVYELSGGNQQKVVFARALAAAPKLLLLDEPTRGVDVGAKFDIYSLMRQVSSEGCSILLTSSDLPELLGMCDRIIIMRDGVQSAPVPADTLTPATLLAQFYHLEAA